MGNCYNKVLKRKCIGCTHLNKYKDYIDHYCDILSDECLPSYSDKEREKEAIQEMVASSILIGSDSCT